jgi:signal transduction histidine kinase
LILGTGGAGDGVARSSFTFENDQEGLETPDLRAMFEPFWRKNPARDDAEVHSGLGLAIVESYVRVLGGRIEAQLIKGGGVLQLRVIVNDPAR